MSERFRKIVRDIDRSHQRYIDKSSVKYREFLNETFFISYNISVIKRNRQRDIKRLSLKYREFLTEIKIITSVKYRKMLSEMQSVHK